MDVNGVGKEFNRSLVNFLSEIDILNKTIHSINEVLTIHSCEKIFAAGECGSNS